MKNYTLLFLCLICSCNKVKKIKKADVDLTGKYSICKTEYNEQSIFYNVCREIEFSANGKGVYNKSLEKPVNFSYSSNNDTIYLDLEDDNMYFISDDSIFKYELIIKKDTQLLLLSSIKTNYKIYAYMDSE